MLPAADAEAVMEVLPEAALPEEVMEALPEEVIEALPEEVIEALEELPAEGVALPDGHEGCVFTSTFWRLQSWTAKLVVAVKLVSWHRLRDSKRHTLDIRLRACSKHAARYIVDYTATANACNVGNTAAA